MQRSRTTFGRQAAMTPWNWHRPAVMRRNQPYQVKGTPQARWEQPPIADSGRFLRRAKGEKKFDYYGETMPPWQDRFLEVSKVQSKMPHTEKNKKPWELGIHRFSMPRAMNLREGDLVQVLYGQDQGKQAVIRKIIDATDQVIVDGCNMGTGQWTAKGTPGPSMVTVELPIHVTNVAAVDPVVKKPTRLKWRFGMNGERARVSKVSGCAMPEPTKLASAPRHKKLDAAIQEKAMPKAIRGPVKQAFKNIDKAHFQLLVSIADKLHHQRSSPC